MKEVYENWRWYLAEEHIQYGSHAHSPELLIEGLNVKDVFKDIAAAAASSGAIVGTGGAGGDVVVDVIFALDTGKEIISEVEELSDEVVEIGNILKGAVKLDYSKNSDAFYKKVKGLLKKTLASPIAGESVENVITKVGESIEKIIARLVRAISKWVATIMPDDFGLSGPAFEATLTSAVSKAVENSYTYATGAVKKLGETGKLLTDPETLKKWLLGIAESLQKFVKEIDDKIHNPDPKKATLLKSFFAGQKFSLETSPIVAIPSWALRKAGVSTDTVGQDFLDRMEYYPSWHPTRKMLQKLSPKIISLLEKVKTEIIPSAVKILRKLISYLFAAIALLQIISNPAEREEMLGTKPSSEATPEMTNEARTIKIIKRSRGKAPQKLLIC